jgi:glycosyltransferase involved in cell wall biosynthesis
MIGTSAKPTIMVAICTYNRNDELALLLDALLVSVARLAGTAIVGVVIVDDSADSKAREVAERYARRFELGITYRISGRQNISLARNMVIETACEIGDWTAMIDDDCEPTPEWLEELLNTQRRTCADAVTGPMVRRVPRGSPKWLTEEPFLELGLSRAEEGAKLTVASTFNSMISSRWLKEHPAIRFQPDLGVIGGEDMVFYRAAHAAGLRICYSQKASVFENQSKSRSTLAYQLRAHYWHGNSSYVASIRSGANPVHFFLHGLNSLIQALARPFIRVCRGQYPQLRYSLASILHAIGKMMGPIGIRTEHR